MSTTAERLNLALFNKADIYAAIGEKGVVIQENPMSGYGAAIRAIASGGGLFNPDDPIPPYYAMKYKVFTPGTEPTTGRAWYVRPGGAGVKDGADWDTAMATREAAVAAASSGDRIYVMEGTYYITTVQTPKYGVSEYYGFTQTGRTWATRSPWMHPSKHDAAFSGNHWRNDTVAFAPGQVVDGWWIQNVVGNSGMYCATATAMKNITTINCTGSVNGGGVYMVNSSIDGAAMSYCSATNDGGGVYVGANCTVNDCTQINCNATNGGGVYVGAKCTINDCTQINCSATHGGGMYLTDSLSVINCTQINCSAGSGGGMHVFGTSSGANCIQINCSAGEGGGMYIHLNSSSINCTQINCTGSNGGGMYVVTSSSAINCTQINCRASIQGGGVTMSGSAVLYNNVSYGCDVYMASANLAYKIYNCASTADLVFATNAMNNATVSNFIKLTAFPFKTLPNAPFDGVGVFYSALPKTEDSIFLIYNSVIPNVADPHLVAGSPLIGTGYYEAGVTPTTDADGKTRPNPPSIGAYEL